jgi:hypothetical protein
MEEPDDNLDGCDIDFATLAVSDEEAKKLLAPDPVPQTEEEHEDGLRQKSG